jgi:hypothetical protein
MGGKDDRCVGLTNLPPSCANCLETWEPHLPGTLRALHRDYNTFAVEVTVSPVFAYSNYIVFLLFYRSYISFKFDLLHRSRTLKHVLCTFVELHHFPLFVRAAIPKSVKLSAILYPRSNTSLLSFP